MPVFFVPPQCITPPTISITGDLLHHLRDSLRITIGETLWFGDGQGTRYRAEITDVSKRTVTARILETAQKPPRCRPRLILGQSLLKGEKMDWVIQKATELGVSEIVPIESRHSVVHLKADRLDNQLTRWQRIALEAAQQSEQWRVPAITLPQSLSTLLASRASTISLMLAERREGKSLQTVELPQDVTSSLLILIGPEGGWNKDEIEVAEQVKAVPITLGQQILRAETAAIAAISILQSRLGQLG
ncbi:16S rRNA (uracil(1498)-N(3))-methyltransferase [Nitrospira sp. BLG_2]|uniref:16S rRNA (uracil(1498)-N(3))-methyltransferase n=1 Tax=Nitrospira sp. BLG_2 TaxID=3397507 RepID=UPI003B9B44E5